MRDFKLPGTIWTALLIGLPLLAVWLNEFFPGAVWAAPVAGLLLIIAKVLEVVQAPKLPEGVQADMLPGDRPSVWWG